MNSSLARVLLPAHTEVAQILQFHMNELNERPARDQWPDDVRNWFDQLQSAMNAHQFDIASGFARCLAHTLDLEARSSSAPSAVASLETRNRKEPNDT